MKKLGDLENYLATNPNKYQQMQNPMGVVGAPRPQQIETGQSHAATPRDNAPTFNV